MKRREFIKIMSWFSAGFTIMRQLPARAALPAVIDETHPLIEAMGSLRFYSDTGEILCEIPVLPSNFRSAEGGTITLADPIDGYAIRNGKAKIFSWCDKTGEAMITGSCGVPGDFADMTLSHNHLMCGGRVTISSFELSTRR